MALIRFLLAMTLLVYACWGVTNYRYDQLVVPKNSMKVLHSFNGVPQMAQCASRATKRELAFFKHESTLQYCQLGELDFAGSSLGLRDTIMASGEFDET